MYVILLIICYLILFATTPETALCSFLLGLLESWVQPGELEVCFQAAPFLPSRWYLTHLLSAHVAVQIAQLL